MLCYSSVCLPYVKFWRFLELGKTLFSILNRSHFLRLSVTPGPPVGVFFHTSPVPPRAPLAAGAAHHAGSCGFGQRGHTSARPSAPPSQRLSNCYLLATEEMQLWNNFTCVFELLHLFFSKGYLDVAYMIW